MEVARTNPLKLLDDNAIRTVRIEWCDLHGLARGKRVSRESFEQVLQRGLRFSTAPLFMDLRGETVEVDHSFARRGWPDMVARPDVSTLQVVPHEAATARVLADLETTDGEPIEIAPRFVLRRVLEGMLDKGDEWLVGAELEFYVLPEEGWEPLPPGKQCFRMMLGDEEQRALTRLMRLLPGTGIMVEGFHPEDGPGQFEINLSPARAMTSADAAFIFRNAVKEVTAQAGLRATFMAKPFTEFSGSGFHLHLSACDTATGEPILSSPEASNQPSEACLQFVAGQTAFAREAAAFYLPTVNSYKRTELRGPEPLSICWGDDNRTVAFRLVTDGKMGVRIENRIAGADANPYLVMAAAIATGMAGRAQGLEPPEPLRTDAYEAPERGQALPTGLDEALKLLRHSDVMRAAMGDSLIDTFVSLKRAEVRRFRRSVTDWELAEYSRYI